MTHPMRRCDDAIKGGGASRPDQCARSGSLQKAVCVYKMNAGGDGACSEEQAGAHGESVIDDPSQPPGAGPRVALDPMQLLLGLLMCQGGDDWHKAERISRRKLEEKYPTACRFRKTDGNIAAIDFGTTFCTLAFATVGDPDLVVTVQQVEINTLKLNKYYSRVPTAILLKEAKSAVRDSDDDPVSKTCDYEVVAFGYDAVSRHSALKPKERSEYLYFERFKMTLQQDEVHTIISYDNFIWTVYRTLNHRA